MIIIITIMIIIMIVQSGQTFNNTQAPWLQNLWIGIVKQKQNGENTTL